MYLIDTLPLRGWCVAGGGRSSKSTLITHSPEQQQVEKYLSAVEDLNSKFGSQAMQ